MSADVQIGSMEQMRAFACTFSHAKQRHTVDLAAEVVMLQVPSAKQDFTVLKRRR